jgi:hypothetical protein
VSGTRAWRVHGGNTRRQVGSLVTTELGEVGARELAVEVAIELCVLRRLLAIRDLQTVALKTDASDDKQNIRVIFDR